MSLRRINFQRLFYDNDCTTLYIKYGKSRFIKDVFAFNFSKRNVISSGAEEWPIQVNKWIERVNLVKAVYAMFFRRTWNDFRLN